MRIGGVQFELLVAAKQRADRVYIIGHRRDLFAALRHLFLHFFWVVGILQIQLKIAVIVLEACAQIYEFTFFNGFPQNRAHDSQDTTLEAALLRQLRCQRRSRGAERHV